jgi:hypothetical protein
VLVFASPAAAQFGPQQTLFRDRVQSWTGTLDVHGVASGTVIGPTGISLTYNTDQHVSGTLGPLTFNTLLLDWEGPLVGTITVSETAVEGVPGCPITNTLTASTSAAVDYLGHPLIFHLSFDIGSDTWSLWPSNNSVNGTQTSVSCAGTSTVTVPMRFMPISMNDGFPFPATGFDLTGASPVTCAGCGNAASNDVAYTFTYNLTATTYPCNYSLSAPSRAFSSRAASGSVSVDTGPSCPWSVTLPAPAPWVTLTSPTTGSGPGTVDFSVSANSGADRSTTMDIGGVTFTIDQGGPGYFTVTPCRVVDTRNPAGPLGGPALQPGATRTFGVVASPCGIPATASAVSLNLTVTAPTAPGYLTLYPADGTLPLTSSINFSTGQTRANNAILPLANDGTGAIKAFDGSSGTVHFILDANGYFQ